MTTPNFPQDPNDWPENITYLAYDFRPAVCDMAKAVTQLELWDYVKNYTPPADRGFMFSTSENITKLDNHPLVGPHGHSGGSSAIAKRYIKYLAKLGWETFEKELRSACDMSQIEVATAAIAADTIDADTVPIARVIPTYNK